MLLNVLRCRLTYEGQAETNAEAWFNIALRPQKPEGSLGWTAQDGHLDSHTAPKLCHFYFFQTHLKIRRRKQKKKKKDEAKASHTHQTVCILFAWTATQFFPMLHLDTIVLIPGRHAFKHGLWDGVDLAHASWVHVRCWDGGLVGGWTRALVPWASEMMARRQQRWGGGGG